MCRYPRVSDTTLYSNVHIQIGNSSGGKIFHVLLGKNEEKSECTEDK